MIGRESRLSVSNPEGTPWWRAAIAGASRGFVTSCKSEPITPLGGVAPIGALSLAQNHDMHRTCGVTREVIWLDHDCTEVTLGFALQLFLGYIIGVTGEWAGKTDVMR